MNAGLKVCYLLSHYISHFRAGMAYRQCLESLGVTLVDHPSSANLVIVHNEPWTLPGYYRAFPVLSERYVVGYFVWETNILPEYYRFCLSLVKEIWTPSAFSQEIFRTCFGEVNTIPHVVPVPKVDRSAVSRLQARISYEDGIFYFYTITNASNPRKNIDALIRAFQAVSQNAPARLIIKTIAPPPPDIADVPGIVVLEGRHGDDEINALHHLGHCFVSSHCAEAWGMGITEAMSHGKIVVATGYGGNMDYMNSGNSLPVAFSVESVRNADIRMQPALLTPEMEWAYIDENDLRDKMAFVCSHSVDLQSLACRAREDMERFSPRAVAVQIGERLDHILDRELDGR